LESVVKIGRGLKVVLATLGRRLFFWGNYSSGKVENWLRPTGEEWAVVEKYC